MSCLFGCSWMYFYDHEAKCMVRQCRKCHVVQKV